ncbi:2Fe-2S iron-sulfur cluster-binding protein [Pseudorhodoplanes sp.]|uniref:2Fe-2S iron-sulfur cluster-binding protein n=1 Tax=Pseudorhodoplanes sp. TaxID=1934341 RepID=UPI003D1058B2
MKLFSYKDRPVHLGPYPLERLRRQRKMPDLGAVPPMRPVSYADEANPESLTNAMTRYIGMLDVVRDGAVTPLKAEIPDDAAERSNHLKAAGYYYDATQMGVCALHPDALLAEPIRNPAVAGLVAELEKGQPKTFAAGIDLIYSDVLESARRQLGRVEHHTHANVILIEHTRDPRPGEPGTDWFVNTQAQRAGVLAANTAVLLSSYIRLLGYEARSHSAACSDVDLGKLAVAAGLARLVGAGPHAQLVNPYVGVRFGLAVVTTTLELAPDQPLATHGALRSLRSHGPAWWLGKGTQKNAFNRVPYARRDFQMGAHPFERLKRVDTPTTFIDEPRVPRFPKRADFFARAVFGDMGKEMQNNAKGGFYVLKSAIGAAARRALGALLLLQFGEARGSIAPSVRDPKRNALNLKAASYYMATDAVGLSRCPEWVYYSHDAAGNVLQPYHKNAISMLYDQGHETFEGASGDDWISVAQSMRAYLRFSLLGGIIAEQIRRLGYSARAHTVLDGDVLQPPLLLLSGLGEVSRIGEVILNPYLGPRLKSGVVTTDLPFDHDKPIDFGLQTFCHGCNKCARECPSGAITAGPKLMYNGYEIWKSDAEKCARYRITNQGGAMCGRCMKTCPWNLEGLFSEAAFRWLAMRIPRLAKHIAALDDRLGRGGINPVKKWWWDIEIDRATGQHKRARTTHARGLNRHLDLKYEDQTLAVYPADVMPSPYPVPHPVDREAGIARYRNLLTPAVYKMKLANGETDGLTPPFKMPDGPPPVFPVILKKREDMTTDTVKFELVKVDGSSLPKWEAGAHIDVVIAPEYLRQYSLAGDPSDDRRYVLGVLRETQGRGGSVLMHRAFREGRRVFISPPRNHFPLDETASRTLMLAGGIGITPMITMAHRLHALGRDFELHYSSRRRKDAGFLTDLATAPWHDRVRLYFTDEGTRADLGELIPRYVPNLHLYTCGSARYMDAVFAEGAAKGWPEEALHREYFSVPEPPDYVNEPFILTLARTGRRLEVPADKRATDVLIEAGITVDMKCSDGICGVCAAPVVSGEVEHRDHVLSAKERQRKIILCCSRAKAAGGEVAIDL